MVQETLKVPRITIYEFPEDEHFEDMQIKTEDSWLTPYKPIPRQWITPLGTHKRQNCQEQRKKVHPDRWESLSLRLYSSPAHQCR